jgi:hypothetical protein
MIINSKQNCSTDLSASIKRTAIWRRELKNKYVNDARNERAAGALEKLATETCSLSDEAWAELMPYYSWSSATWSEHTPLSLTI